MKLFIYVTAAVNVILAVWHVRRVLHFAEMIRNLQDVTDQADAIIFDINAISKQQNYVIQPDKIYTLDIAAGEYKDFDAFTINMLEQLEFMFEKVSGSKLVIMVGE